MIDEITVFKKFFRHRTDKADQGYDKYYANIFKEITPKSILEIGIRCGGSLLAWRDLFPEAEVVGVDLSPSFCDKTRLKLYPQLNIETVFCDASTSELIEKLGDRKFDLIVDDGSHFFIHQMKTFDLLKDRFNYYYVMEDARWRQDEVLNFIKEKGFNNIEIGQSDDQINIKVNRQFLEDNKGFYYNSALKRKVSKLWYPFGKQVLVNNHIFIIKNDN